MLFIAAAQLRGISTDAAGRGSGLKRREIPNRRNRRKKNIELSGYEKEIFSSSVSGKKCGGAPSGISCCARLDNWVKSRRPARGKISGIGVIGFFCFLNYAGLARRQ